MEDKEQEMKGRRFITGSQVEVRLPDEHCTGAWFLAVVLKEIYTDLFLVEYESLRINGASERLKDVLDIQHIRCTPPTKIDKKEFDLLEEVDAFFDFGWWTGVVRDVLAGNRYEVSFKHQKEQREFNQFELRTHLEWDKGIWVRGSSQVIQQTAIAVEPIHQSINTLSSQASIEENNSPRRELDEMVETDSGPQEVNINEEVEPLAKEENSISRWKPFVVLCKLRKMAITRCSMQATENISAPFIKTLPIWKKINSMEVFRSLPQSPRFLPLEEENVVIREGLAAGYMLSFGNIAEKTKTAQINEPNSFFETKLNALTTLEAMGIKVDLVRARLQALLQVKEKKEKLNEKLKEFHEEIITEKAEVELLKNKGDQMDEELGKLEETLGQLKNKRKRLVMEKETKGSSIAGLQEKCQGMKRKLESNYSEFRRVAAESL